MAPSTPPTLDQHAGAISDPWTLAGAAVCQYGLSEVIPKPSGMMLGESLNERIAMENLKMKSIIGLENPVEAKCGDQVLVATGYLGWGNGSLLYRDTGRVEREVEDSFLIRFTRPASISGHAAWIHKSLIASVLAPSESTSCQNECCCCKSCPRRS